MRSTSLWPLSLFLVACAAASSTSGEPPPIDPTLAPTEVSGADPAPAEVALDDPGADGGADAGTPEAPAPAPAPHDGRPRLGSIRWQTMIWEQPARPRGTLAVGAIRIGTSVVLKSKDPVVGSNCAGKWYAVEPRGYVCTDETTTLDLETPYFKALASLTPGPGAFPYRYAFSTGAPMYSRIPTPEEQEDAEMTGFGPKYTFQPMGKWSVGHEWLVEKTTKIEATDEIPAFIKGNEPIAGSPWHPAKPKVRVIPAGSGFSYVKAFKHSGRVWLLTPELYIIPADRVFPYKFSQFGGVELGKGVSLPLAWVRAHEGHKKHRRQPDGSFVETADSWAKQAHVQLTGKVEKVGKMTYHQTREDDAIWLLQDDAVSIVTQVEKTHPVIKDDEKWIDAHLLPGTMTAYIGKKPVWTTLWSGGVGGVPTKGRDPKKYANTELGLFAFQWKDKIATMSPDTGTPTVQWFGDVPHIQYIKAPLAMHVSYWHDRFGYLMSAECLNISPRDGEWLFNFTDPPLPEGWSAIAPSPANGRSTRIHIKAY